MTDTQRRPKIGLADAARTFRGQPSPWMLGAVLVAAVVARLVVADWGYADLILVGVMLAVFPLAEWIIHVCVLHWRPRRLGPVTIDPLLSRKHRAHHADPRDVPLVFIPWQVQLWLLPATTAIAVLAFPRLGNGLTFLVFAATLGLGYEWMHYLIHSDYRPKTRLYRAIWRNHRLHHYKNEHYWFTVTTSGTADRALGTHPNPETVRTSPTVRDLHSREAAAS
jgi:hypothetical protein